MVRKNERDLIAANIYFDEAFQIKSEHDQVNTPNKKNKKKYECRIS